jgi:hypothetical protein
MTGNMSCIFDGSRYVVLGPCMHLFNSSFNTIVMLDYYSIKFYSRKLLEEGTCD